MKINRVITTSADVLVEVEVPGQKPVSVLVVPRQDGTWLFSFSGIGTKRVVPFQQAANQAEVRLEETGPESSHISGMSDLEATASLYGVAMSASYALEGVKDNRATNMAVAQSLLDHRDRYLEVRDELVSKMWSHEIAILDRHHGFVPPAMPHHLPRQLRAKP